SRRRHTRFSRDWSSDVCSSDLRGAAADVLAAASRLAHAGGAADVVAAVVDAAALARADFVFGGAGAAGAVVRTHIAFAVIRALRSEERRVGKERASAW